jgi:hypothetical protein
MPGIPLGYSEIETIKGDAKPHRTPKALRAKSTQTPFLCCVSTRKGLLSALKNGGLRHAPSLRLRFGSYQDKHPPHALVRFH